MTIGQKLLQELLLEAEVTRSFLESVPFDQADYQPTEKSERLGRLAIHIAEIVAWWKACIDNDKLDFLHFKPVVIESTDKLLIYFDGLLEEAKASLLKVADDVLTNEWSMTHGEDVLFTLPKEQVLRLFCMNHLVHHRAQLGVYLRLLAIDVPATYGPSADDDRVVLTRKFSKGHLTFQ